MHCVRKVTDDLYWIGANDRRLAMFEGVYAVPDGVSYNSYLLLDETNVLFDTVDSAVSKQFMENLEFVLDGRKLDYVVVQHMEPDHTASLSEVLYRHPETVVVCNKKTAGMIGQFFKDNFEERMWLVDETTNLNSGKHSLRFVMAPMIHWPEVMMTYDETDKILFSADAFGCFGALNGAIFADEVNFMHDYMDEARRYYCNIVGKYGVQVQSLLKKAAALEIQKICPLHGFVWRKHLGDFIEKYQCWSTYTPEEQGVVIAYASIYGNTANAADVLACKLREAGIKTVVYDTSVTADSVVVAEAFRYSHLVFAASTYNAGIFVSMENLLHDLAAHNIQKRTVALIENGSWAATAGKQMRAILDGCKEMNILNDVVTICSSIKDEQEVQLDEMVTAIVDSMKAKEEEKLAEAEVAAADMVDTSVFHKFSYGLFVLTAREGSKDNGCIINTAMQLTSNPQRIQIAVNKQNYTHDMIQRTGVFNVSFLTEEADFAVFKQFGFQSGRDTDKFAGEEEYRTANGVRYLERQTNAVLSAKVVDAHDYGSHTLFVAEVTEARVHSNVPSVTYAYYFAHIKPKPQPKEEKKTGWVCKICGYVYEGEELPADFICPLCKHGAADFEKL